MGSKGLFSFFVLWAFSFYGDISWTSTAPSGGFGAGTTPLVALDSSSNAVAVWIGSGATAIKASYYTGGSWSTPVDITSGRTGLTQLALGIDNAGNALASWAVGTASVEASIFDPGTDTWSTVADLTAGEGIFREAPYSAPTVNLDNSGTACVTFGATFSGGAPIRDLRTYVFATDTWTPDLASTATTLIGSSISNVTGIDTTYFVTNAFGPTESWPVASYGLSDFFGTTFGVGISFYFTSLDFVDNYTLEALSAGNSGIFTSMEANDADTILVIWSLTSGGSSVMRFSYVIDITSALFSAAATISGSTNDTITEPVMAMDASGNAFAAWVGTNAGQSKIQAAFYTASSHTWSSVFDVSDEAASVSSPKIAIDLDDRVVIIWNQGGTIYSRENTSPLVAPSTSWSPALASEASQVNTTSGTSPGTTPSLGMNRTEDPLTGPVFALWDSGSTVFGAIEGDAPAPLDPLTTNLQGAQFLVRYAAQGDLINVINWTVPDPSSIAYFKVYRDSLSNLIATPGETRFIDHQVPERVAITYYVTSVNTDGEETLSQSVIVPPISF